MNTNACGSAVQDVFGPIVADSCQNGFDFTLLFEEAVLTVVPLVVFAIWAIIRLVQLQSQAYKVKSSWLLPSKFTLYIAYTALQIVLVSLWSTSDYPKTRLTVSCNVLTAAAFTLFAAVSWFEHFRSISPSTLLNLYLGTTLLLDLARLRSMFNIIGHDRLTWIFLSMYLIKVAQFVMEAWEKRRYLLPTFVNASPEEIGGIFNRMNFLWLNPTFIFGFKNVMSVRDLPCLDREIIAASEAFALRKRWASADKTKKNALFWVFFSHYKIAILKGVLPRLVYAALSLSQPYLVQCVLDFAGDDSTNNARETAYTLIGAYAIVYVGLALSYTYYQHKTYRLTTLYRGSLITLIFDKTMRVQPSSFDSAEAVTLMSADIDRIAMSISLVHEIYASIIETGVGIWLLYTFIGYAMAVPLVWIVACLALGLPVAKAAADAQVPWLEAIEDRLSSTAKALGAIRGIKMTGLSESVSDKILDLRQIEIRASLRHRLLNICLMGITFTASYVAPVLALLTYVLLRNIQGTPPLTEGIAFGTMSLFELLDQPIMYILDGMEDIQTIFNSFTRIQQYLLSTETESYRIMASSKTSESSSSTSTTVDVNEKSPTSTIVASPSSLTPSSTPLVHLKDASAAYTADAEPCLSHLSLDIPADKIVIIYGPVGSGKSTLLKLLLGEMPITSGAIQTAFRQVAYCPQAPWCIWGSIKENVVGMSAWDEKWYNTVISACALRPDLEQLPQGDQTIVGTRGMRLSGGQQTRMSLCRALYSRQRVMLLDDALSGLDGKTELAMLDAIFGPTGCIKTLQSSVVMATSSVSHLQYADHIIVLDALGAVVSQGTLRDIDVGLGDKELKRPSSSVLQSDSVEISQETLQELDLVDDPSRNTALKSGDIKTYAYFAKVAGYYTIALYLFACAVFVFGITFPSIWVQWWTNSNIDHPNERLGYWLGVFGALGVLAVVSCVIADSLFNLIALPRTSAKFHKVLLDTTMRAPTKFLTSTDAGQTINRFSQDLELIDNDLPNAINMTIFHLMSSIVSAVLVFIGSGYVAAAIPLCIVALLILQFYYLRTSRQLRLLDIEAKAPLFSLFFESLQGVMSIRAFGWTDAYMAKHVEVLNISQRPYYIMFCIQRWLSLVLDLFNAAVAVLLVGITLNLPGGSTGYLGVALFNIVTFSSTLQSLVTEWTQVETALGAIKRIQAYTTSVPDENLPGETGSVSPVWPAAGCISIRSLSASYGAADEPVLNSIDLEIKHGEKVAICGRTGSGKSSLVSTLLRLLEVGSGSITIDGVDISTVPRQIVRERINTLPQEPFFLHGSIRENLDPHSSLDDDVLIAALRDVGLWSRFSADGLDADMDEEMLSHGQRKLFCLAKTLVKPSSILIMDEATSSVDAQTDQLIQEVIHKRFVDCTIIAVAHKLSTVENFDTVIVLDKGAIIERGNPASLLEDRSSAFYSAYHDGANLY